MEKDLTEKLQKLNKLSTKFPSGANIGEYYEEGAIKLVTTDKIEIGTLVSGGKDLYEAIIDIINRSKDKKYTDINNHDRLFVKMLPIFKHDEKVTRDFLNEVKGKKNHDVTDVVRRYRTRKKIDEELCHKHMWKIFVGEGMYNHSDRNWNERI